MTDGEPEAFDFEEAFRCAVRIGLSPREFDEITPRELMLMADEYVDRRREDFETEITLAYLNALWTIQWLGKKHQQPKPLKTILASLNRKEMTDEELLEKVKALNAMLGGEVRTVGAL